MDMGLIGASLRPLGWRENSLQESYVEYSAPCAPVMLAHTGTKAIGTPELLGRAIFRGCQVELVEHNAIVRVYDPHNRDSYLGGPPILEVRLPQEKEYLAPAIVPHYLLDRVGQKPDRSRIDLERHLVQECVSLYENILGEASHDGTMALALVGQLTLLLARGLALDDSWERDIEEVGIKLNSNLFSRRWVPSHDNSRLACLKFIRAVRSFAEDMPASITLDWLGPRVVGRVFEQIAGHIYGPSEKDLFGERKVKPLGRKRTGTYFTPPAIAEWLGEKIADALFDIENPMVLDPAMGTGSLLWAVASAIAKRKDQNVVSVFQRSCVGIDIDELAVMSAQIVASLHCAKDKKLPRFNSLSRGDGLQEMKKRKPNCIVMNPPFITYNSMASEERPVAKKGRKDAAELFAEAALECVGDSGVFAAILPRQVLNGWRYRDLRNTMSRFPEWYVADFGSSQLFHGALVYVCAVVGVGYGKTEVKYFRVDDTPSAVFSSLERELHGVDRGSLTNKTWPPDRMILYPKVVNRILDKMKAWPTLNTLSDKGVEITKGIIPHKGGKAAIISYDEAMKAGVLPHTRPIVLGDSLSGPILSPKPEKVIIWPYHEDDSELSNEELTSLISQCGLTGLTASATRIERPREMFRKGRSFDIAVSEVGRYLSGSLVLPEQPLPWVTYRCIAIACDSAISPWILTAYLSSVTAQLWARVTGKALSGDYYEWGVKMLWDLPIPPLLAGKEQADLEWLARSALYDAEKNLWKLAKPWADKALVPFTERVDGLSQHERLEASEWLGT